MGWLVMFGYIFFGNGIVLGANHPGIVSGVLIGIGAGLLAGGLGE